MTWECGCGVVNRDSKVKCRACQTPKGMVWTPDGFQMSETGVEKKRLTRQGSRGFTLIDLLVIVAIVGIIGAIVIPNFIQASRKAPHSRAASDTKTAVTQAIKYAQDKGAYPTSITVLREEGYANIRDKDPWGNEWVLSPVLARGNEPKEGDNVYVFSRGSEGTGGYPQPFTSDTGREGSIGYSSLHGRWGYQ